MSQTAIPFLFMRGGSSRGPYLSRADLPEDRETLAEVLIAMIGAGHPLNIDGIGGGAAVTTKVAMLSRSKDDWADIDYFFAQVSVEDRKVDFKPTCGNILVGVGPAAIEMGLIEPKDGATDVRIRAVNTGARVSARIRTGLRGVTYEGDTAIDGVPGMAAPVDLQFMDVVGGATGTMFPTGSRIDRIDGVDVSCIDVAMPIVIARADAFGLTAHESVTELDENRTFMERIEAMRRIAGEKMGMGDVSQSVIPKFAILGPAANGGTASVRYFMPQRCHPTLAVTGAQCVSACLLCPGTVSDGLVADIPASPARLTLEHPTGTMDVTVDYRRDGDSFDLISAGLVRTARKLAAGDVFVPGSVWSGIELA
ncbi:MAG: 4-oxalomesaconate tautomerase [Pseudomonadota bacterium]